MHKQAVLGHQVKSAEEGTVCAVEWYAGSVVVCVSTMYNREGGEPIAYQCVRSMVGKAV